MPEMELSVTIDRPAPEVYDYLTNPEVQTLWQSGLVEYHSDWEEQPKTGDHAWGVLKVAGRRMSWKSEITEADRPRRYAARSVEAPFPYELSYILTERDGSTQLTVHLSAESSGGFFGKLADPLVARLYERDMTSNLENLKTLLEQS